MSTEDIEDIDLEVGPRPPLQRMNTSDTAQMIASRKKFEDRLRAEYEKPLTSEEQADIFARGSPETRQEKERQDMFEEDPKERREYFEAEMEPWGQEDEKGGRRTKTHRKRHYKKKTLKKRSKTNRKYKKSYKKKSMKRPKK
jgi:hypothetical protein